MRTKDLVSVYHLSHRNGSVILPVSYHLSALDVDDEVVALASVVDFD